MVAHVPFSCCLGRYSRYAASLEAQDVRQSTGCMTSSPSALFLAGTGDSGFAECQSIWQHLLLGVRIARGFAVALLSVGAGAAIETAVKPEVSANAAERLQDNPQETIAEAKVTYPFHNYTLYERIYCF